MLPSSQFFTEKGHIDAQQVRDYCADLEAAKGGKREVPEHTLEIIETCESGGDFREVELTEVGFRHLVFVDMKDSKHFISNNNRLLKDVAEVAAQNIGQYVGGWDTAYIERLSKGQDLEGVIARKLVVRTVRPDEPRDGSFYLQDGNHRALGYAMYLRRIGDGTYRPISAYVCNIRCATAYWA